MTTNPTPARPAVRIKSAADVVSAIPFLLGFTPTDSLVMVTGGGVRTFHARMNLPRTTEDTAEATGRLLAPAIRESIAVALFVAYADEADAILAERVGTDLAAAFHAEGIRVPEVIVVTGDTARSSVSGETWTVVAAEEDTTPTATALRAAGSAPVHTREDVAAMVAPAELLDPALIRGTRRLASTFDVDRLVARQCKPHAAPLEAADAAALLAAFADGAYRDVTLARDPQTLLPLLLDLTRRAPMAYAAHPAAMTAFCAWLTGDGALAWCAVDRAREADPHNNLAGLVAHALDNAVPPPAPGNYAA